MCALNRLTLVRSLFFAAGLVNQTKMLNIVRHVMKLFCQLDNCSSTYSHHKILVCYNNLFNPEMKRVNFFYGKECSLTCLLLWRGPAYITQDKWNKLAASENSGLLQYFTIIRQVFIMLCYSGTTYVLPALKGNLVMTVYRHCPAASSNAVKLGQPSWAIKFNYIHIETTNPVCFIGRCLLEKFFPAKEHGTKPLDLVKWELRFLPVVTYCCDVLFSHLPRSSP